MLAFGHFLQYGFAWHGELSYCKFGPLLAGIRCRLHGKLPALVIDSEPAA